VHGEEDEENGNGPQGVECGKEGGRLQVDKREEKKDSPVEHGEEDEENGNGPQGVEFGKEGGRLQVDKREEKENQEQGDCCELAPHLFHCARNVS
jgi:hypothetical protein